MSTATQTRTQATQEQAPPIDAPQEQPLPVGESPSGHLYRGRTVAELIPRIQSELGPEAIVLRRRSGLEGGLGGFFQRPFVEIEAREGGARIDLYDGRVETPEPTDFSAFELASIAEQPTAPDAGDFADALAAAGISISDTRPAEARETATPAAAKPLVSPHALSAYAEASTESPTADLAEEIVPAVEPAATPAATPSKTRRAVLKELLATGMNERFAEDLIDAASVHVLAFSPRIGLRNAVRIELERRIPVASPLPSRGAAIVLVGPGGAGKTRCIAALAGIYGRSQAFTTSCAALHSEGKDDSLKLILDPACSTPTDASSPRALRALAAARAEGLTLVDTHSLSPADHAQVKALGKLFCTVKPDRVTIALPATLSAKASSQLLKALMPLGPSALAITHSDETDQIGVAVQAACESGIAPEYLLGGGRIERALSTLTPASLAQRLLQ
jgi:flagellar biosynthesis GTPase FlhF